MVQDSNAQAIKRDDLLRRLTLIEHHARQARELLCACIDLQESSLTASPLAGVQPNGQAGPSQKQVYEMNAMRLLGQVHGHLGTLTKHCEGYMAGVSSAAGGEDKPAVAGKLHLA